MAHRVMVNGVELAYEVHGQGPHAIAIPGGPGLPAAYLRMPQVEHALTIVYVDPIGTGASGWLADPARYSRSRDVADVEALRQALGLGRVYTIGHSYGGFVALEHALAHPDALAGLILYDTSPTTDGEWRAQVEQNIAASAHEPWFPRASGAWVETQTARDEAALQAAFVKLAPFYVHEYKRDPARWDAFFAEARISFERTSKATRDPYDVRARLGEIRVPALVLVGAADFVCFPRMAQLLADQIADAELVTFANSGHFPHVEDPAAFAQAIASFVAKRRERD
jgi:pimeloyl-ACP methyl ester carboxylesterase